MDYGIGNQRSTGYYHVKQSIIQHHLKPYYEIKPLEVLSEEFNKLTSTLKRKEQQSTDAYPWLAEADERRNLTDREVLGTHINA